MPVSQPIKLIAALPGITASDAYIGLNANPVVHGRIRDSFLTNSLTGSFDGAYFTRDRMTVLAGRLPRLRATREIALSPGIARLFGVGVGGQVTYQFYRLNPVTYRSTPGQRLTFRVTGIVDIPPVLVDQSDEQDGGVLPPAATRQLLPYYVFSWVGVRLDHGTAGIPALQHRLATLATTVQRRYLAATHQKLPGLTFAVARQDIVRNEVRQASGPQVVALAVFGSIAALAMLVLAGQGLAQLMSRRPPGHIRLRALGAAVQTALAASSAGRGRDPGATILAVAYGAIALPRWPRSARVRQFDPARGVQADGSVLGAYQPCWPRSCSRCWP
jgi:hypothetical protein